MHWLILFPLLAVCCVGPGYFCVRKLRLTGDEKLCASIGLSLALLYLLGGGVYLSRQSWHWAWLGTAICLILTALSLRDLRSFLGKRHIRRRLAAFGSIFFIGLLLMMLIQHHGAAAWAGDWREHYDRTLFFLEHQPADTQFLFLYKLPARPPMMHLIAAFFMAQTAGGYDTFEVISLFLNTLVFFPCVLLAGMLVPQGNRRVWLIAAFFLVCPMFIQNITWTWNKLLAGFFVIFAVALYLRGWRMRSSARVIASAASMALAMIVHYSAGPFAIFLGAHYFFTLRSRPNRLREMSICAGIVSVILATWFICSISVYGVSGTFGATTTIQGLHDYTLRNNVLKILLNFYYSIVPYPVRTSMREFTAVFDQPNPFGSVRDYYFLLCQQNLPGSLGFFGCVCVIYLAWKMFRAARDRSNMIFWIGFACVAVLLGIGTVGADDPFGVAHVCLQSLTLIGMTLLAAGFMRLPRWMRITLAGFVVVDVVLGIILHIRMEMLPIHAYLAQNREVVPISPGMLNLQAVAASAMRYGLELVYLSDHFGKLGMVILPLTILAMGAPILLISRKAVESRSMLLPAVIAAIYLLGATAIVQDQRMGYTILPAIPVSASSQAEAQAIVAPLDRAVADNPESVDARYALASTLYYLGYLEPSWTQTYLAALLDPENERVHYLFTIMRLAYKGAFAEEDDVTEMLYYRSYLDTLDDRLQYGEKLFSTGLRNKALQVLRDTRDAYPDSSRAHSAYGGALYHAGRIDESRTETERALRMDPRSVETADHLRQIMRAQNVDDSTIEQYLRQIRGQWRPGE